MTTFPTCDMASVPEDLPRGSAPLFGFARLLRRFGFAIAPEQVVSFISRSPCSGHAR